MNVDPSKIFFGLSDKMDRTSLSLFLQLAGKPDFADLLANRLSIEEINTYVDGFMVLLKKHLKEDEYHKYFLGDDSHSHKE